MATWYSDVATNQVTGANFPGGGLTTQPGTLNNVLLENGNLTYATVTYTMVGTEAASDVINLLQLNEGESVVPVLSYAVSNAAAATITLNVGDTDASGTSASRYAAGLNVATSGTQVQFAGGAAAGAITPFVATSDSWITATFATLATPSAGKVIVFRIAILQVN